MTTPAIASTVSVRSGDILVIPAVLANPDGSVLNLTGKTVAFQMYPKAGGTLIVNSAAAITNAAGGAVTYTGTAADTALAGQFTGYFMVTTPGAAPVAYPADGITVAIYPVVGALTGPGVGPCFPWTTADAVRGAVAGIDPLADLTEWIEAADEVLYNLTGRQFKGLCRTTIRPGHESCSCGGLCAAHAFGWPFSGGFGLYGSGWPVGFGAWLGGAQEGPRNTLICASEIDLGHEARLVESIKIDGVEIDPTTWRLDPLGKLVRQPDASGNRLCWPCFNKGVLVLTSTGLKPIETIQPGEMVLTHRNRWRRVLRAGQTGESETVRVKGRGGEITCTPDHQFWASELPPFESTHSGTWNRERRKLSAPMWADAADLVGKTWATPRRIAPLPIPLHDDRDLPANFWWVVGRWVGDGWTEKWGGIGSGKGAARIVICAGHHESDYLASRLAETGWSWKPRHERTGVKYRIVDRALWAWLNTHFGIGARNKRLPAWLLGASKRIRKEFMEGYLSADGFRSLGDATHGAFTSVHLASRDLALGLRLLVASLGFAPTSYQRAQSTNLIEGRPIRGGMTYTVAWPTLRPGGLNMQAWTDNDHLWGRVKSVVLDETVVPVYDLEVEEDHSFIADGFVTHNCCQRVDLPSGQPGTFEIRYLYGQDPPASVVMAVNVLAGQFWLASNGSGQCKLPRAVQTMTRQGVTATFLTDVTVLIEKGYTGISTVDLVIKAFNPNHLTRRARVISIDVEPHRRMTP